ncbi:transposase [Escherichia coli]
MDAIVARQDNHHKTLQTERLPFHLVPFGLNKTHDLLEVEDASEAIRLVIDERHSIRCSTLTATITNKKGKRIKRTGIYSIKGVNIKEYNVR